MKKHRLISSVLTSTYLLSIPLFLSCGGPNTVNDPHFDENGYFIKDTLNETPFEPAHPNRIKVFVEVSGSMNGFFRANAPTKFKEDVWRVLNYYAPMVRDVSILTNDGSEGESLSLSSFQSAMNTGTFVSSASTKVPTMLQSILRNINPDAGEAAILISDMKYSPVGSAAPQVLLTQYSTDVSSILSRFGKAVCLVGATSEYLDKKGTPICNKSPYYFLILGNQKNVACLRNEISTLIENNGNLIDNIESGFDYGTPSYSFGIPDNCYQLDNEPTFLGVDESNEDTCTVRLKINLENYRWATARKDVFPQVFQCKALYGSEVEVKDIEYQTGNITDKELKRKAVATVDLKVYNMAMDSEVIEWTLQLPDTEISGFAPYFGATGENDVSKSYSIENFIKGIFYGRVVNKSLKPCYILISQKS